MVLIEDGEFVVKQGWAFNNLTYLPYMTKAAWGANPLANTGEWTATTDDRKWRTECGTAAMGRDGCRSYAIVTVYKATAKPEGGYTFSQNNEWVFNNIVMFGGPHKSADAGFDPCGSLKMDSLDLSSSGAEDRR